jgi:hypothetical protein
MTIKSFALVGLSSLLLVAGCGSSDDSKPAAAEGTPNKSGAASATTSTITAVQTAIKPSAGGAPGDSGQASANQLASAAQATQNLVTPAAGTAAKSVPGLELIADLLHPLAPTGQTGTCTCTADSCTFVACSNGSLIIDGTYSYGGGKIKATGLKYTIDLAGAAAGGATVKAVITIDADITATATSINGSFHSAGSTDTSAGGQTYSSTWDSTLEFKAVTFPSGGGAATGGSEHVAATTTVNAGGGSQSYQSNFDITFPAN